MQSDDSTLCTYSAVLMGSPVELKLFHHDEALASGVFRLIKSLENTFTVNRPNSEIMVINHAAGIAPVNVSQLVFNLVQQALSLSLIPGSCFNLAIGPLVKCWKIGFQGNSIPAASSIAEKLALTDPKNILMDQQNHSVYLLQKGMEIDLGAIAKGYIADCVRNYLQQQGVHAALINLGGNVHTLGSPPTAVHWSVGLKTPFSKENDFAGIINVSNKSVVTSGVYERFFEIDGKRYHHIFDPKTGYPLNNDMLSVTVISATSLEGDAWTTLLYGMGIDKALAFLANKPELDAIFITHDHKIIISSQRHFSFTAVDPQYQVNTVGSA
ncbi:MAG: FAD:protein FMN transferase [Candidatus Erwinia impunctatus]|nr:FAD:protein FMN transferase [Culicoides impunctatus]